MGTTYESLLDQLASDKPLTASLLKRSHERRKKHLESYLDGTRMRGFEALLVHVEDVHTSYAAHPVLSKLAFLIKRATAEFGVALEALLGGFHTVSHDAMRSVMEIEFLLRDFALDLNRIDEWLTADRRTLRKKFSPAELRERYAKHLGVAKADMAEATDYEGHSMFLHVGPQNNPFGMSGGDDQSRFAVDSCFWEISEHARRLILIVHELAAKVDATIMSSGDGKEMDQIADAWARTQEMQLLWQQMIGVKPREGMLARVLTNGLPTDSPIEKK